MPISTLNVTELSSLTITINNEGTTTISYPGQNSITISANSYGQMYTYGCLGSTTNPLVFAVKIVAAPTGLSSSSYVNNSSLALALGTNSSAKYAIVGNGDIRPMPQPSVINISVDNQSNTGGSACANYAILHSSSSGAVITLYHP